MNLISQEEVVELYDTLLIYISENEMSMLRLKASVDALIASRRDLAAKTKECLKDCRTCDGAGCGCLCHLLDSDRDRRPSVRR
jgi:hypothetical protein